MKKLFVLSLLVVNLPAFGLTTSNITNGCNANRSNALAIFEADSYTCQSGTYLPAGAIQCASCPSNVTCAGGTFVYNESVTQGLQFNGGAFTSDLGYMCLADYNSPRAMFTRDSYTCTNGNFLPANSVACASCPSDATCDGGWFEFDETQSQGIVMPDVITQNMNNVCYADLTNADSNNNSNIRAVFYPNTYNCTAGQYLPANGIECATCPADSYCLGGTYTFNETTAQGATACASGTHSSAGSSSASQCIAGYTCSAGQYLPKNTTVCASCPDGYTCAGGTYSLDTNNDQGLVGNTITVIWNGATAEDVEANNAGTVTYGGDIRTPVRPDPSQIPAGKRFVGWTFRKTNN